MSTRTGSEVIAGIRRSVRNLSTTVKSIESMGIPLGRLNGVFILLVVWYLLAWRTPAEVMPYPSELLGVTWQLFQEGVVMEHLLATFSRTFWGFLGALGFGVAIGIAVGLHNYARKWLVPYVMVLLSLSGISAGAIGVLIFKFSILAPVVATIITVFPYIAINVWKGVENVDRDLMEMSTSFDVTFQRKLRRLIIPNIAPSLFAAFRFGLATSWKIVTITEMFAASKGLGYKLLQSYTLYQFEKAWAWGLLFLVVILLIEYGIFKPLERRMFEYRAASRYGLVGV